MEGSFRTTASMVARLTGTSTQCWFTATPLPHAAVFKPFAFPSPARRAEVAGSGGMVREDGPVLVPSPHLQHPFIRFGCQHPPKIFFAPKFTGHVI